MRVQPSKRAIGKVEGENTPLDVQLLECSLGGQRVIITPYTVSLRRPNEKRCEFKVNE